MKAKELFDRKYEVYRNLEGKLAIPLEARQMIFDCMEEYAQSQAEQSGVGVPTLDEADELVKCTDYANKIESSVGRFAATYFREGVRFAAGLTEPPKEKKEIIKCPECLQPCSQEELDMFGGLCEKCNEG